MCHCGEGGAEETIRGGIDRTECHAGSQNGGRRLSQKGRDKRVGTASTVQGDPQAAAAGLSALHGAQLPSKA